MTMHYLSLLLLLVSTCLHAEVRYTSTDVTAHEKKLAITITLKPEELLYADTLTVEADHPALSIAVTDIQPSASQQYDPTTRSTKKVYANAVTVHATATNKDVNGAQNGNAHVVYRTNKQSYSTEKLIPLSFEQEPQTGAQDSTAHQSQAKQAKKERPSVIRALSDLFKNSNSQTVQLLLALLLGILMSLTPCIYPMIPITVGILHNYGTKSFAGNALRSLLYAMGMATTYAILGLLASCTGPLCGQLLSSPIFIYILVAFLAYMAGSMLGLYDLYIPRFLQIQQSAPQARSLVSVFLFGAVSGTIASPCVSPGLALILSVVATMGNQFLGFLLLFFFGIGLSMPLLVVGTFSSSFSLLPRAGLWMNEVKKLFGFLLLGLCVYYLQNVLSPAIITLLSACMLMAAGVLYLAWARKMPQRTWKQRYHVLAALLITAAVYCFMTAAHEILAPSKQEQDTVWLADLDEVLETARRENKLVFIDVWAQFCSICKAINKTLLAEPDVIAAFKKEYVLLKVDGTTAQSEPFATLQKRYNITGFPVFMIVNPHTNAVIKQWGGELYGMKKELFIEKINKHAQKAR